MQPVWRWQAVGLALLCAWLAAPSRAEVSPGSGTGPITELYGITSHVCSQEPPATCPPPAGEVRCGLYAGDNDQEDTGCNTLWSANRRYYLRLGADARLVLWRIHGDANGTESGGAGGNATADSGHEAIWASAKTRTGCRAAMVLTDDGTWVVYCGGIQLTNFADPPGLGPAGDLKPSSQRGTIMGPFTMRVRDDGKFELLNGFHLTVWSTPAVEVKSVPLASFVSDLTPAFTDPVYGYLKVTRPGLESPVRGFKFPEGTNFQICQQGFSEGAAQLACRMDGYYDGRPVPTGPGTNRPDAVTIPWRMNLLSNVSCPLESASVSNCTAVDAGSDDYCSAMAVITCFLDPPALPYATLPRPEGVPTDRLLPDGLLPEVLYLDASQDSCPGCVSLGRGSSGPADASTSSGAAASAGNWSDAAAWQRQQSLALYGSCEVDTSADTGAGGSVVFDGSSCRAVLESRLPNWQTSYRANGSEPFTAAVAYRLGADDTAYLQAQLQPQYLWTLAVPRTPFRSWGQALMRVPESDGGLLRWEFKGNATVKVYHLADNPPPRGEWVLDVWTRDLGGTAGSFYRGTVGGGLRRIKGWGAQVPAPLPDTGLVLGAKVFEGSALEAPLRGRVATFLLYNRSLGEHEVTELFSHLAPRFGWRATAGGGASPAVPPRPSDTPASPPPQLGQQLDAPRDGDLRLVGGPSGREGRLEVFYGGEYGQVCDDRFSDAAAAVACGQLGFPREGAAALCCAPHGEAAGARMLLDEVECAGNETRLEQCRHSGWGVHDCARQEAVSVRCSGGVDEAAAQEVNEAVEHEFFTNAIAVGGQTPQKCGDLARAKGFALFAIFNLYCYATRDESILSSMKPSDKCNPTCFQDPSAFCGASVAYTVFRTAASGNATGSTSRSPSSAGSPISTAGASLLYKDLREVPPLRGVKGPSGSSPATILGEPYPAGAQVSAWYGILGVARADYRIVYVYPDGSHSCPNSLVVALNDNTYSTPGITWIFPVNSTKLLLDEASQPQVKRMFMIQRRGRLSVYSPGFPEDVWIDVNTLGPDGSCSAKNDATARTADCYDLGNYFPATGKFSPEPPPVVGWRWMYGYLGETSGYSPASMPELDVQGTGGINCTYQLVYERYNQAGWSMTKFSYPSLLRFQVYHPGVAKPTLYVQLDQGVYPSDMEALLLQRVEGDTLWTVARLTRDSREIAENVRTLLFTDTTSRDTWGCPADDPPTSPRQQLPGEGAISPTPAPSTPDATSDPAAAGLSTDDGGPFSGPIVAEAVWNETQLALLSSFGGWDAERPPTAAAGPDYPVCTLLLTGATTPSGAPDPSAPLRAASLACTGSEVSVAVGALLRPHLALDGATLLDTPAPHPWGVAFRGLDRLELRDSVLSNLPLSPLGPIVSCEACGLVELVNVTLSSLSAPSPAPTGGLGPAAAVNGTSSDPTTAEAAPMGGAQGAMRLSGVRGVALRDSSCTGVTGAQGWACVLAEFSAAALNGSQAPSAGLGGFHLAIVGSVLEGNEVLDAAADSSAALPSSLRPSGGTNATSWGAVVATQEAAAGGSDPSSGNTTGDSAQLPLAGLHVGVWDSRFTSNRGVGGSGLASLVPTTRLALVNSSVVDNTASGVGGAFYVHRLNRASGGPVPSQLLFTSGTVLQRNSALRGGVVYTGSGEVDMIIFSNQTSVFNNSANDTGGVLLLDNPMAAVFYCPPITAVLITNGTTVSGGVALKPTEWVNDLAFSNTSGKGHDT
ncbi:hypothetical protein HYH03_004582 [Edaphochlamys debaryana]|uniref:SRCR domain-containing protein n=1 Tax=Edaphochlamys debaryana TaxID=47281 RepID=A0A836C332_9CHLO|nr:hypothetical protein HYH03_004582 [Edaphochlamys debaryana]|eukprot:KAG2497427.1 hypothetical protein HYH03_004582 [Edaphochlamys debaryana]